MLQSRALKLAAVYNLIFGFLTLLFPEATLTWAGMEAPRYPQIWQCLGMVIGVYGVGYWIAASDPIRHWPIVFVGFLGKIFGPIGFVWNAWMGVLPWSLGWMIITNDLIWWIPFGKLLWMAWSEEQKTEVAQQWSNAETAIKNTYIEKGKSIAALSNEKPVVMVFLRHLGCTFCMEALHDLGQIPLTDREGIHLVLVSMGPKDSLLKQLNKHGVQDVFSLVDEDQQMYRAFQLKRGSFGQLFGLRSLLRGIRAFSKKGVSLGALQGDGFQMPGCFVIRNAQVIAIHRAERASEVLDYQSIIGTATKKKLSNLY